MPFRRFLVSHTSKCIFQHLKHSTCFYWFLNQILANLYLYLCWFQTHSKHVRKHPWVQVWGCQKIYLWRLTVLEFHPLKFQLKMWMKLMWLVQACRMMLVNTIVFWMSSYRYVLRNNFIYCIDNFSYAFLIHFYALICLSFLLSSELSSEM